MSTPTIAFVPAPAGAYAVQITIPRREGYPPRVRRLTLLGYNIPLAGWTAGIPVPVLADPGVRADLSAGSVLWFPDRDGEFFCRTINARARSLDEAISRTASALALIGDYAAGIRDRFESPLAFTPTAGMARA